MPQLGRCISTGVVMLPGRIHAGDASQMILVRLEATTVIAIVEVASSCSTVVSGRIRSTVKRMSGRRQIQVMKV